MATKRSDLPDLSPAQREIMEVVWDGGEVTAKEVRSILSRTRSISRNTVRTLIERMEDKG
jgi:predicted transcriptional regulator